jgi:hypothetical protein
MATILTPKGHGDVGHGLVGDSSHVDGFGIEAGADGVR